MKKQFLNLGKALNKTEQKSINGGEFNSCEIFNQMECSGGRCFWDNEKGICLENWDHIEPFN